MDAILHDLVVVLAASEEFVPPDEWRTIIALPMSILFFLGGIYLLLRSNLGTRRAYLVQASSMFAFMVILSLFWGFGAPGTPQFTGPTSLPGQPNDYYSPKWEPFAADSVIGQSGRFSDVVASHPDGFEPAAEESDLATRGAQAEASLLNFFQEVREGVPGPIPESETWVVPEGGTTFAQASDGTDVVAIQFAATDSETGAAAPDQGSYVAYGYWDPGFPILPTLVVLAISLVGFALHIVLLMWDENRQREVEDGDVSVERSEEPETVPVGASA